MPDSCFLDREPRPGRGLNDLENVDLRLNKIQQETKLLRRRAKQAERAHARLLHDAFILYVLTDNDMAAPTALVARFGSMPNEALRNHLERTFLATTVEELAAYTCSNGRIQPRVMKRTEIFFQEWNLARWVNRMNEHVGTAPGYEDINKLQTSLPAACAGASAWTSVEAQAVKKRISRWRKRWRGKLGRVPTQGGGSVEAVSNKVGVSCRKKNKLLRCFWAPKRSPFSGPKTSTI